MAAKIISVVGEGGFNALYDRSLHQVHSPFPWLRVDTRLQINEHRLNELKTSLIAQPPALALEANIALLITFTDMLASLIGEQLTISILRSAWSMELADDINEGQNNE